MGTNNQNAPTPQERQAAIERFRTLLNLPQSTTRGTTPTTVEDLGRLSLEMHTKRIEGTERAIPSTGKIRIVGAGLGPRLDLDIAGKIQQYWQQLVTTIGQALITHLPVTKDPEKRYIEITKLQLVGTPQPGSIIFNVSAKTDPLNEVYKKGNESLVGLPEPLVDVAVEHLTKILSESTKPEHELEEAEDAFIKLMVEAGPKPMTTLSKLTKLLEEQELDLSTTWYKPSSAVCSTTVKPQQARWMRAVLKGKEKDPVEETLIGTLQALDIDGQWRMQLEDGTQIRMKPGNIPPEVMEQFKLSQQVQVEVETTQTTKPGGIEIPKFTMKQIKLYSTN